MRQWSALILSSYILAIIDIYGLAQLHVNEHEQDTDMDMDGEDKEQDTDTGMDM